MQLECQEYTDSVMWEKGFWFSHVSSLETWLWQLHLRAAHGESLCLTPKEVNTTFGVDGLSRTLKVIPTM